MIAEAEKDLVSEHERGLETGHAYLLLFSGLITARFFQASPSRSTWTPESRTTSTSPYSSYFCCSWLPPIQFVRELFENGCSKC